MIMKYSNYLSGYFLLIFITLVFYNNMMSQNLHLYEKQYFISGNDTLPYRILYPGNFDPEHQWPVILFLHGSGERGTDNEKQLTHGAGYFLDTQIRKNYPAVIIFPQCSANDYWAKVRQTYNPDGTRNFDFLPDSSPTPAMQQLIQFTQQLKKEKWADTLHFYIAGLSMGGMGTFELIYRMPGTFRAAVPICGGGNLETAAVIAKHTACYIFHGQDDDVVNPDYSVLMAKAIENAGGEVILTLFPDTGHNAWDKVFMEKQWLEWMMKK